MPIVKGIKSYMKTKYNGFDSACDSQLKEDDYE
jgi:hypothetical protein